MRSFSRSLLALSLSLSGVACGGSDRGDPASVDAGAVAPGGNPGPAACGALRGSCRASDHSACADYYAPLDAPTLQTDCEADGDATWSTAACDTTGAVGGCRVAGAGQVCADAWAFAPVTPAQIMQACVAPNTYLPPR